MFSYAGKILFVDLSTRSIKTEELKEELVGSYLGGLGINAKLAYDLIEPGSDPLGPENVLIFGVGSLVGTMIPTASRTDVTAKSPITNLIGTTNSGAFWGPELKFAGYDHLVITGRSEKPVFIWINPQ